MLLVLLNRKFFGVNSPKTFFFYFHKEAKAMFQVIRRSEELRKNRAACEAALARSLRGEREAHFELLTLCFKGMELRKTPKFQIIWKTR